MKDGKFQQEKSFRQKFIKIVKNEENCSIIKVMMHNIVNSLLIIYSANLF